MKVVVENGSSHPLTRADVESLVARMTEKWDKKVKTITLYKSQKDYIYSYYYNKEKVLGIFCLEETGKEDAIDLIYLAFGCLKTIGDIPKGMSASKVKDYVEIGRQEVMRSSNAI